MKRYFIFATGCLTLLMIACGGEYQKRHASSSADSFAITGQIAGMDSGWVMISHVAHDSLLTDSALVINDRFTYKGVQSEPAMYAFQLKGPEQKPLRFFVENAKISIIATRDSFIAADIVGSPSEEIYKIYRTKLMPVSNQLNDLDELYSKAYQEDNQSMIQRLDSTYDVLNKQKREVITKFVHEHDESIISAWAIAHNFLYNPEVKSLSGLYQALGTTARKSSYGKKIEKALVIAKKLAIGETAPDFTQNDVDGHPFSLSSLRGKYVLIDFWASWCGPCRAENPNVVKEYNKYEDQGFTVLGVSLDNDRADWLKAIKKDHLTWSQVSDLKGWKNAVARQYGIRAIPANFLIDPQGKIVGHTLRGEKLDNKLAAIFSRP